jgi:hypothetical protein
LNLLFRNAVLVALLCGGEAPLSGQDLAGGRHMQVDLSEQELPVTETLRIGSVDGSLPSRLSRVIALAVSPQRGEVLVLDGLERSVSVFDTAGRFLRSWGREGGGPGEFRDQVVGMAVARDSVLVADVSTVHIFDLSGTLLESFPAATRLAVTTPFGVWPTAEGWTIGMREVEPGVTGSSPHQRFYALDLPREELIHPWLHQLPRRAGRTNDPLRHTPLAVVSHDGLIIGAPSASYELLWTGTGDEIRRRIEYRVPPVPYPPGVRRAQEEVMLNACDESRAPQLCLARTRDYVADLKGVAPPPSRPAIEKIIVGRGRILIGRGDLDDTPHIRGNGTAFDLLDGDGMSLGRLSLPPRFTPMWLDESSIWGVVLDSLDVPFVLRLTY